ncbi:MAG TPA: glycosyltransferase family 9 protein, partial [Stellaceae bacterium]|nr:glycosyltransferase family 9 protein [Stellaceae bacterium]
VAVSEITLLGCQSWASLAPQFFPGCRFIAIDEHAYERNPLYRFKISLWVRRQGFAVAICDMYIRRPLVADALLWVSGAPERIATNPHSSPRTAAIFSWYLQRCTRTIDTGPYPTHEIVRHFRFLSALAGRDIKPAAPALPWPGRPRPLAEPYAVLNLGGNSREKRWPARHFFALAEELAARGLRVVFVGGPSEPDLSAALAEARQRSARGDAFLDRIGATALPELLDLLQHAALVVSSDTGPAHLAVGVGAPSVVILGGGHFTSFVPYPPDLTPPHARFVWRELPCYHCFWACTQPYERGESFPCMAAVSFDDVHAAVEAVMAPEAH